MVDAACRGGLLHDGARDMDACGVQRRGGRDGVVARLQAGAHRRKEDAQRGPHGGEGGQDLQQAAL